MSKLVCPKCHNPLSDREIDLAFAELQEGDEFEDDCLCAFCRAAQAGTWEEGSASGYKVGHSVGWNDALEMFGGVLRELSDEMITALTKLEISPAHDQLKDELFAAVMNALKKPKSKPVRM